MVNVHMFFLSSTSFVYVGRPRGSFLHCLMDPLLAHLGWDSPLIDGLRGVEVGHF